MPTLETLRAKVGATLLDVLRPGWATAINASKLDLSSCDVCVLGQLFGGFSNGAEKVFAMGITSPRGDRPYFNVGANPQVEAACIAAGFMAPNGTYNSDVFYNHLTTAWKREIAKRTKSTETPAAAPEPVKLCDTCTRNYGTPTVCRV